MDAKTLKDAKADLEKLMDEAVDNHEPVIITREGKSPVVLVSLADWNSQQETEYLLRNPANRKRLLQSIAEANKGKFAKDVTVSGLDRLAAKK
jgi:antitoxin YefM